MISYILIGLLGASLFALVAFFFSLSLIYKKKNNKSINLLNTFTFEATPKLKRNEGTSPVLLFVSLGATIVGAIVFASRYMDVLPIVLVVIMTIMSFTTAMLPLLSLNKLKEHLYLNLGSVISFATSSAFLTYLSYSMCKAYDYKNASLIIAMVISGLLFLFSLFFVFNPQLFNLNNDKNEDGEAMRKKFIPLAFSEWMIIFSSPIFLIPLILISSVIK